MKNLELIKASEKELCSSDMLFALPLKDNLNRLDGIKNIIIWGDEIEFSGKKVLRINPKSIDKNTITIKPKKDYELALLLSRFLIIENRADRDILDRYSDGVIDFYEMTQTLRIKAALEDIGIELHHIGKIIEMICSDSCAIIVGSGVMRYPDSLDILRSIESAAFIGGLIGDKSTYIYYNCDFNRVSKDIDEFEFLDEVDIEPSNDELYFIGFDESLPLGSVSMNIDASAIVLASDTKSFSADVIRDESLRRDCVIFSSGFELDDIFEVSKYYDIDAKIYKNYKLRIVND